ncbi:STY0301 family protein [Paucibacter sp. B51]|uniref:STY0301 family protein n=1 Tax=Paucibacter sp. B51 TaxID=2993315 RepID=UPI003FA7618D
MLSSILLLAAQSASVLVPLSCPPSIRTNQSLTAPVQGWRSSNNEFTVVNHELRGGFYGLTDGPPDKLLLLVPSSTVTNKRGLLSTWVLEKSEGVWLVCGYQNTTIQLSKPLPAGLVKCLVQTNNEDGGSTFWCE